MLPALQGRRWKQKRQMAAISKKSGSTANRANREAVLPFLLHFQQTALPHLQRGAVASPSFCCYYLSRNCFIQTPDKFL
jgi:hypothetical protein